MQMQLLAGAASIEGARTGSSPNPQRIAADAGFIKAQKGGSSAGSGRRLSGSDVTAAASKFLSPDGSTFYPGGTSWCALRMHIPCTLLADDLQSVR